MNLTEVKLKTCSDFHAISKSLSYRAIIIRGNYQKILFIAKCYFRRNC